MLSSVSWTGALALLLTIAGADRSSVDVSFGWRFALAGTPACNATSFPISMDNIQVYDMSEISTAQSPDECRAAACTNLADVWQWCPGNGLACGAKSCWVGPWTNSTNPQNGWVSARRNTVPTPLPTPPEAAPSFPDASWDLVDLPHDFEVTGVFDPNDNNNEGSLPWNTSFYRKHFVLPASWTGTRIELYVGGALSASQWWLNGKPLGGGQEYMSSYTAIVLRLDDSPAIVPGGANVICGYVDGTKKTGWWYEGAGLYRRITLTSVPLASSIATHGIDAPANITGNVAPHSPGVPAGGLVAPATIFPKAMLRNDDVSTTVGVAVNFTLLDATGALVVTQITQTTSILPNSTTTVKASLPVPTAELWSVARPYLYTLVTSLVLGGGVAADTVVSTIGVRSTSFDANTGFYLNKEHVKMRGFCNHENFGSLGAAIPPRIDLLRVQQLRGVGGNAWRTSHNAPETALLDITDRLGVLVMDENRVFATTTNQPGVGGTAKYDGNPVADMADLVSRDKLHSSVVLWSFCNEGGCGDGRTSPAQEFRDASYAFDGSRSVTGNNVGWNFPQQLTNMSRILDVMGFSHSTDQIMSDFHKKVPGKPIVSSECCSCETQRGEDADQPLNASTVYHSDEASGCLSGETQRSNGEVYNVGTFIWTLHDYLGEPDSWPHVSSSFGSFDVAGIPKAASFWLRSWWLSNITKTDAGRPAIAANTAITAYIVESWAPQGAGKSTRSIHAYSNAPYVRLLLNGAQVGADSPMPPFGSVNWPTVAYAPGILTLQALSGAGGSVLASHTRTSWGAPAAIVLTCDSPSPLTGTGSAVYLDGTDVALLRATVMDAAGVIVADSTLNITFSVTDGPGLVLGSVSGNPSSHDPNAAPWKPAYHGIVRAIVRANIVAVGDRALLAAVNSEAGGGPNTARILPVGSSPPTSMTIIASAPGLPVTSITIQLSVAPADEVMAVAAANVARAAITE